jgi:hypothetical protein
MSAYLIAYIVIGVLLFIFLLDFIAVLLLPHTHLYQDKKAAKSQTLVQIQVDKDGREDVYINGVKQELPSGKAEVRVPANREFDPKKDVTT